MYQLSIVTCFSLGFCCCFVMCNLYFLLGQALLSHRKPLGTISRAHSRVSTWLPNILDRGINFHLDILVTPMGSQSIGESLSCLQGCATANKKQVKTMFIQQHRATKVQLHKMTNPSISRLTRRMLIIRSLLFLKRYKECSKLSVNQWSLSGS